MTSDKDKTAAGHALCNTQHACAKCLLELHSTLSWSAKMQTLVCTVASKLEHKAGKSPKTWQHVWQHLHCGQCVSMSHVPCLCNQRPQAQDVEHLQVAPRLSPVQLLDVLPEAVEAKLSA